MEINFLIATFGSLLFICNVHIVRPDVTKHRNWPLLNGRSCGTRFSGGGRVIGGTPSKLGRYPWIARLGFDAPRLREKVFFSCAGVLISDRFVLTAAHCFTGEKLKIVRLGEWDVKSNTDCVGDICADEVQDIAVRKEIIHERFNARVGKDDIALLLLARAAKLSYWVMPVCLVKNNRQRLGSRATVAGWGISNITTRETPDILKELDIPIVAEHLCRKYLPAVNYQSHICAGGIRGQDSCGGDSGGPLMKVWNIDGTSRTYLIGIVSLGPEKCGVNTPGVYTKVSFYLSWILDHMDVTS